MGRPPPSPGPREHAAGHARQSRGRTQADGQRQPESASRRNPRTGPDEGPRRTCLRSHACWWVPWHSLLGSANGQFAAYGADVLWVTSPNLPALPNLDVDTSRGKRTTQLDLNSLSDRQQLRSLVAGADVFLQAYRPGGLASRGFGVDEVTNMRPGIVYASLCAYGWEGPWKNRRGVRLQSCLVEEFQ